MNRKARRAAKSRSATTRGENPARDGLALALARLEAGDPKAAEAAARAAMAAEPGSAEAHYLLANALLMQGKAAEAEASYVRAIGLSPELPEAHNNLGIALERQGRMAEATERYRAAIGLRADYAEAHNNLGNALPAIDRAEEGVDSLRAAIAARKDYPEAWYNLANLLRRIGREAESAAAYMQAVALRPRFPEALNNLSALLLELGRPAEAEAACRQALAIDANLPESRYNLANALRDLGRIDEAVAEYKAAAELRPSDADAYISLGNLLQQRGRSDEAFGLFRHAQKLRPLSRRAGAKSKPDFSVLLLTAPGAGNTPSDYLVGRANYDSYFLGLMEGVEYDSDTLRSRGDVVMNLISDVDRGGHMLPIAAELVERIGRPVLNHPNAILNTGRERIAERLSALPGCRVPKTVRRKGHELSAAPAPEGIAFPLLVRIGGAHGGQDLEQVADAQAVARFAARRPQADHYVTEYVPYESADGYFRKYRFISIDGELLPYHLAIDRNWKVHHFRTDMANQEWMRREEEAFVREPRGAFGPTPWEALRAIQSEMALDYFGIDCALDPEGRVLVFEVNATMLVHGEKSIFAYKQPYIARIKRAFDAMLAKAAGRAGED